MVVNKNNDKKIKTDKQAKQINIVVAKFGKTIGLNGKLLVHSYFTIQSDILNFEKFTIDEKDDILVKLEKKDKKILAKIVNINS